MRLIEIKSDTWYDAGLRVGRLTRDDILHVDAHLTGFLVEVSRVDAPEAMLMLAAAYLAQVREAEPRAADWLDGLAAGSGLPVARIALIAFSEEIRAGAGGFSEGLSKCSTAAVYSPEGWIVGHNEDYEPHYLGRMYVLDLQVGDGPRVVSLNYPGMLPHLAGSLNWCGIAVTNNSLWPDAQPRLSNMVKQFRAALATGFQETVDALTWPAGSLTSHYLVVRRRDAKSIEVSNPECAECEFAHRDLGENFVHTNHALYLRLLAPDPAVEADNHTLVRYAKLLARLHHRRPATGDALMGILTENDGVIHRTFEQCPTSMTLATLVIEPGPPGRRTFRVRGHGQGESEIVIRI